MKLRVLEVHSHTGHSYRIEVRIWLRWVPIGAAQFLAHAKEMAQVMDYDHRTGMVVWTSGGEG